MIRCDTCPRYKDSYPGKVDEDGYHYGICGMTGNIVYAIPHKIKRYSGHGYISLGVGTCGIFETIDDVLKKMTEPEIRRWKEENRNESNNGDNSYICECVSGIRTNSKYN